MFTLSGDLEKEKKRLQNILAGVQEDPKPKGSRNLAKEKSVEEEKDRFEEGEKITIYKIDYLKSKREQSVILVKSC